MLGPPEATALEIENEQLQDRINELEGQLLEAEALLDDKEQQSLPDLSALPERR